MIQVKYGEIPKENFCNYFHFLIGRTYKILPMKEENCETLKSYLEGYQRELLGSQHLFELLVKEPMFISILNTIQFLIAEEYSIETCKKEVFKCIRMFKAINKKYFQKEDGENV